jgi:hypothetical protein
MTQTQVISQDIRRHPDSSIDFDFYRTRATALRRQALRDATTLRSACAGVLTIVGALAVVFLVAAAPMRAPNGHVAVVQTNAAPIW